MNLLGTLHRIDDERGAVRVEDVYDTDIDDLWAACTEPARLRRWLCEVTGDVASGEFATAFTSGYEGTCRVEVCDRPHRLVLTTWEEPGEESTIEATLTAEGDRTRLVVEERGVPVGQLPSYGAGWQVHAEDLAAHVAGKERDTSQARWRATIPAYEQELGAPRTLG